MTELELTTWRRVKAPPLLAPSPTLDRRRLSDLMASALVLVCAAIAVSVLSLIVGHVALSGWSALNLSFFTERPLPPGEVGGGVAPAIVGTLLMLAIGASIGVPVGVFTAIYLSEFGRGGLARMISFVVDLLAGLPSIVIGVFVWAWLVRNVIGQYNGLAGGVALAIVMIPIVTRTVQETLRLVPDSLREASLALGIPTWRTILRIVLPTARTGLITGIMLSLTRAGGETAPLLLTALGNQFFNLDPRQPMAALSVQIFQYARSPYPDWHAKAWAGALVLIVLGAALSALTRWALQGWKHFA